MIGSFPGPAGLLPSLIPTVHQSRKPVLFSPGFNPGPASRLFNFGGAGARAGGLTADAFKGPQGVGPSLARRHHLFTR